MLLTHYLSILIDMNIYARNDAVYTIILYLLMLCHEHIMWYQLFTLSDVICG